MSHTLRGPAHSPACGMECSPPSLARRNSVPNGAMSARSEPAAFSATTPRPAYFSATCSDLVGHLEARSRASDRAPCASRRRCRARRREPVQHRLDRTEPVVAESLRVVARARTPPRRIARRCGPRGPRRTRRRSGGTPRRLPAACRSSLYCSMKWSDPSNPHTSSHRVRMGPTRPSLRELADGADSHRALEVDVELRLRKGDQVAHRPMVASDAWERGARSSHDGPSRRSAWPC